MHIVICDDQTTRGRREDVARWIECAESHHWTFTCAHDLTACESVTAADLLLVHTSHSWVPNAVDCLRKLAPTLFCVAYSGGGPSRFEAWNREFADVPFGNLQSVSAVLGVVLKKWHDIANQEALFELLTRSGENETTSALAILCQGYLAVHAVYDDQAGTWGPPEIAAALEQMGWPEAMANDRIRSALRPDLQEYRDDLAEAKWWLDVFGFAGDVTAQVTALRQQVEKEWKGSGGDRKSELPTAVVDLLDGLAKVGFPLEAKAVADAYCAIAERLGGDSCKP